MPLLLLSVDTPCAQVGGSVGIVQAFWGFTMHISFADADRVVRTRAHCSKLLRASLDKGAIAGPVVIQNTAPIGSYHSRALHLNTNNPTAARAAGARSRMSIHGGLMIQCTAVCRIAMG